MAILRSPEVEVVKGQKRKDAKKATGEDMLC